jgi:acyl-CoA synthetase (NDP forming)
VAVVSNTRGGALLAADACSDAGLQVASLASATQQALRDILPRKAAVAGPVDTTVLTAPAVFRRCLELAGADPGVDAILALTATTAAGDLVPGVSAAQLPVPIAVAVMDQVEVVRMLPGPKRDSPAIPAYAYPESAARALGCAARHGTWRATPPGRVPDLEGLQPDRAKELVAGFLANAPTGGWLHLANAPTGGWLHLAATAELLSCYGVPLAAGIAVTTEATAIAAAERFTGPVALKADVPGLPRTSDAGAVVPGLHNADDIWRAFRSLQENFGEQLTAVIIQPMITGGTEVTISMLHEQVFGPLVLLGPRRAATGALADRAARIIPLTDADADDLIRSVPGAPLLPRPHPSNRPRRAEGPAAAGLPDRRRPAVDRRTRPEPRYHLARRRAGHRRPGPHPGG